VRPWVRSQHQKKKKKRQKKKKVFPRDVQDFQGGVEKETGSTGSRALFPHPALPCSYSFEYGSMAAILTAIFLS
jgi:hypothetical protein